MSTIPNLLGVHALVWVGGWNNDQATEAIRNSKEAGYGLIEIPALDPKSIDVEHTSKTLKEFDMKAACSLGLTFDADINNDDSEIARRGEERLMDALTVVEKLGGDYLGGVVFSALGKYSKPTTPKAIENATNALRRLAQAASERGVTVGLEPVNRYESNLINTGQQALDMINNIGEKNVVVHLDVYHMNIEEQDLVSPVLAAGSQLGYVHIGASHRGPLGTGNVDFDSFFGALATIGYKGTITFESFSSSVVSPDLSSTLAIWRNLWTDNKAMAKSAREYMEAKIVKAHSAK
ncbi:MAG: sugar phosphate isomerase/epimerase [Streptomycetaceae bacterium]|nr:MAG: sugar phosphate isomerase/epimerase [Streptomycetaceae bacterium]